MSGTGGKRRSRWTYGLLIGVAVVAACFAGRHLLAELCVSRARSALARNDAADASEWLQAARRFVDDDAETHFLAARVARRLGDPELLREHLERAHELGWPAERLEREWILAQAQAGLLQQAEPYLKEMLMNPGEDGPEICAAFANGYVHHYQFQQAFNLLEAWQGDFPEDAEPYLMRGKLRQRWRQWSAAESDYRAALDRAPDLFEARWRLAAVLAAQHKYEQARQHYRACLEVDGENPELLRGWADCLVNLGHTAEAAAVFNKLVARNSDDCSARLGLGQIALADGRVEDALMWLEPAAATCSKRPDLRYVLARALLAAGRREEAAQHFEYYDRANAALARVSELTSHLVRHPNDLEARFEVGRLYMEYGSAEEGANWLKTILAINADHVPTHALLAAHYEKTGERDLAERHRARAGQIESPAPASPAHAAEYDTTPTPVSEG